MSSERYIVNVEAAVVDRGRYLLAVRGMGEGHAAGAVSLIGGKVEGPEVSDDVLEETLRREVEEEVSSLTWMTNEEVLAGEEVPAWTRRSISLAEQKRRALGW